MFLLQCCKELEHVPADTITIKQVNRLTRELEILTRQHNDASSASASDSGAESSTTIPMIPDGRQHCKQQRWCMAQLLSLVTGCAIVQLL